MAKQKAPIAATQQLASFCDAISFGEQTQRLGEVGRKWTERNPGAE
jgi:hypothetical protein